MHVKVCLGLPKDVQGLKLVEIVEVIFRARGGQILARISVRAWVWVMRSDLATSRVRVRIQIGSICWGNTRL